MFIYTENDSESHRSTQHIEYIAQTRRNMTIHFQLLKTKRNSYFPQNQLYLYQHFVEADIYIYIYIYITAAVLEPSSWNPS